MASHRPHLHPNHLHLSNLASWLEDLESAFEHIAVSPPPSHQPILEHTCDHDLDLEDDEEGHRSICTHTESCHGDERTRSVTTKEEAGKGEGLEEDGRVDMKGFKVYENPWFGNFEDDKKEGDEDEDGGEEESELIDGIKEEEVSGGGSGRTEKVVVTLDDYDDDRVFDKGFNRHDRVDDGDGGRWRAVLRGVIVGAVAVAGMVVVVAVGLGGRCRFDDIGNGSLAFDPLPT